ncbi:MAG: PIN domain-containing protein [Anaerolineae bacterium]|nr:PIN domain-containing protein [Anaerolineae bacterium]MCI0608033.1 PIN domain-containing protein [Anaerolineae bacterium]
MTHRIFTDSSVLFSAANSVKGHSRDLMIMGANGEIMIILSDYVLEETRRNLSHLKQPLLDELENILVHAGMEVVKVNKQAVLAAAKLIVLKDAPIIAAAKIARVDMLVSLDRKHILNHPELETYIKASILTPAEAFQKLKATK